MNVRDELESLAKEYGLTRRLGQIQRNLSPAISMTGRFEVDVVPGARRFFSLFGAKPKVSKRPIPASRKCSHFGGLPDVPKNFDWPTWRGRPLSLLAQINCAEISVCDKERLWPAAGLIFFFYDLKDQPWGGEPSDLGGWRVIYTDKDDLSRDYIPSLAAEGATVLPEVAAEFGSIETLPVALSGEELEDSEFDSYSELRWRIQKSFSKGMPLHQSLGHAESIQGPVEDEWSAFATHKIGSVSGEQWRLLLQFDSDDALDVMWGDAGMLYFGITESAFRERQFDQTLMTLQCS